MAATVVDNVKIKVLSTGTGALQLGSAVDGYRGLEALTNGQIYNYAIRTNGIYEIGQGTYLSASGTLSRSVQYSSNGNDLVTLPPNCEASFVALAADLNGTSLSAEAIAAANTATEASAQAQDVLADISAIAAPLAALPTTSGAAIIGTASGLSVEDELGDRVKGDDLASTSSGKGGALVGFRASGTGAATRTVEAKLRERISLADFGSFTQYLSAIPAGFFSQNGGDIHRMGRVMLGAAQRSDLAFPNVQRDWFTTFQTDNGFPNGAILNAQIAAMNDGATSETGAVGGLFAIQSKNFASAGTSAIGLSAHVVNNHASLATLGWGFYVEAHKTSAAAGPIYAIELDTRNTVPSITPHPWQQGDVIGIQVAAGAEFGSAAQDASAGIQFAKNPDKWKVGIVFQHDSLTGASGGVGSAAAMVMAPGHELRWMNSAGVLTSGVFSDATLTTSAILKFSNGGAAMRRTSGEVIFDFAGVASAANYISVGNNTAGAAPYLAALGSDTNIDFQISPKGTGVLRFGTWTSNADAAVNGYVTIKDSAGNTRKLATIA